MEPIRVFVYSYRDFDEAVYFQQFAGNTALSWESAGRRLPWKIPIWRQATPI